MPLPEVHYQELGREHNDALVGLFRACPIIADFTVCFDRDPEFFLLPELVFDSYYYRGIFIGDRLAGCIMAASLTGWLGDRPGSYCYIGDARVAPDLRGSRIAPTAGWELLAEQVVDKPLAIGLIKDGNMPATHLTEATVPDSFEVDRLARFEAANLILLRPAPPPRAVTVRRATAADIPAIAELSARAFRGRLLAPMVTAERLAREVVATPGLDIEQYYLAEDRGELVGAVAAWEMASFKRTLILRYSRLGKLMRAGYQLGRLWFRRAAALPAAGEPFREVTLTRMAIPDRDPEILRDLLRAVVNDYLEPGRKRSRPRAGAAAPEIERSFHMIHVGFTASDPLIAATEGFFVQRFRSTLFVGWEKRRTKEARALIDGADPYFDISIV